jgi:hypothetical protein
MGLPLRTIQARARIARGWSLGFYIAGIAALGAGLLVGGIVAAATGSAAGLIVAAIVGGTGVGTSALGLWESRRFRRRAERLEQAVSEQQLYSLAEKHAGVLRVVDVARGLQLISSEAEELLDHLVDEVRVSMRVTDDGEILYVFRELATQTGPRVRVALRDEASPGEAIDVEADASEDTSP